MQPCMCHSLPGLSKAARVGHLKAIVSMAFFQMCGATSDDIIYITLPLYHMSASLLGIGGCIHLGKNNLMIQGLSLYPQCSPDTLRRVPPPPTDRKQAGQAKQKDHHKMFIENCNEMNI